LEISSFGWMDPADLPANPCSISGFGGHSLDQALFSFLSGSSINASALLRFLLGGSDPEVLDGLHSGEPPLTLRPSAGSSYGSLQ